MLISVLVNFLPIIIAIVFHEVAHGYAAYLLGDSTAKQAKRLSLNPFRHADLFGTFIVPALLLLSKTGFIFGWAKPVPVNYRALKHPRRDIVIVASAGIVTNIILAVISAFLLRAADTITHPLTHHITVLFLINMVVFNIVLAVFNALPVPPLDGSKIFLGWSDNPKVLRFLDAYKEGTVFIVFIAFILPALFRAFGWNFNPFGVYIIKTSQYFTSLLL